MAHCLKIAELDNTCEAWCTFRMYYRHKYYYLLLLVVILSPGFVHLILSCRFSLRIWRVRFSFCGVSLLIALCRFNWLELFYITVAGAASGMLYVWEVVGYRCFKGNCQGCQENWIGVRPIHTCHVRRPLCNSCQNAQQLREWCKSSWHKPALVSFIQNELG